MIIQEAPHHAAAAQAEAVPHVQVVIYKLTGKSGQECKILKIILDKWLIQTINIFKRIYNGAFTMEEKNEEKEVLKAKR